MISDSGVIDAGHLDDAMLIRTKTGARSVALEGCAVASASREMSCCYVRSCCVHFGPVMCRDKLRLFEIAGVSYYTKISVSRQFVVTIARLE